MWNSCCRPISCHQVPPLHTLTQNPPGQLVISTQYPWQPHLDTIISTTDTTNLSTTTAGWQALRCPTIPRLTVHHHHTLHRTVRNHTWYLNVHQVRPPLTWRPIPLTWRPIPLTWRPILLTWRPIPLTWRPILLISRLILLTWRLILLTWRPILLISHARYHLSPILKPALRIIYNLLVMTLLVSPKSWPYHLYKECLEMQRKKHRLYKWERRRETTTTRPFGTDFRVDFRQGIYLGIHHEEVTGSLPGPVSWSIVREWRFSGLSDNPGLRTSNYRFFRTTGLCIVHLCGVGWMDW